MKGRIMIGGAGEGSVSRRGIFRSWCGRGRGAWGAGGRGVMGRGGWRGGWLCVNM